MSKLCKHDYEDASCEWESHNENGEVILKKEVFQVCLLCDATIKGVVHVRSLS